MNRISERHRPIPSVANRDPVTCPCRPGKSNTGGSRPAHGGLFRDDRSDWGNCAAVLGRIVHDGPSFDSHKQPLANTIPACVVDRCFAAPDSRKASQQGRAFAGPSYLSIPYTLESMLSRPVSEFPNLAGRLSGDLMPHLEWTKGSTKALVMVGVYILNLSPDTPQYANL
ncbi:hypothetical protein VTK26DRAFT_5052 [Humicola hyalothermophila]